MPTVKKERFDFRLDENLKKQMEEAASLLCIPVSTFVIDAVRERAAEVINEHRRIALDEQNWARIQALLDNPPQPTERMKAVAARYHDKDSWTWQKN